MLGADLSHADLSLADLGNALLRDANLTNTKLIKTNRTDAVGLPVQLSQPYSTQP
jgi:uncharacterized protein YjbI with pentapeptide repeats